MKATHYSSLLRRLNLCLEMGRWMEVTTRLTVASALDKVHADRHVVVGINGHAIRWMSIATFRLCARANSSLILATNLSDNITSSYTEIQLKQVYYSDASTLMINLQ